MLTTHQFTGTRQFSADGRFLLYQECTTPGVSPRVSIFLDGQPIGKLFPGDFIELDQVAARWEVFPDDASCSGVVVIGNGSIRSLRTMGTIDTGEFSLAGAVGGSHYLGGLSRTAAASLFASIGLANGATSRLAVRSARVNNSGAAGSSELVRAYRCTGDADFPITTMTPANKISSGAASGAIIQSADSASGSPASIVGVSGATLIDEGQVINSAPYQFIDTSPLILLPGESLWITAQTAATFKQARFEFERL